MPQTIHSKPLPVISIDFGNKFIKVVGKNKGNISDEGVLNRDYLMNAIKISHQGFEVFPSKFDPSDPCVISNIKEDIGNAECTFDFTFA